MTSTPAAARPADPRIAFFDQLAPVWDTECSQPAAMFSRLEALDGELGLAPGLDLLEVGCGTGLISGWLAGRVHPGRVVAADFSAAMLDQARQRGHAAEYQQLDICAESPAPERFDRVLCFNAFPHFRDQPAALRQIRRLLKPGGSLTILHLAGSKQINAFHAGLREPVCHDRLPAECAWPVLLHQAGLELTRLTDREDLFLLQARRSEAGT
jgi:ubiquinone/menaquinone biosynthesis C-methylase UbiE